MNATRQLTLGSLFDGSGGFPLAGKIAGIIPIWASEIEPFPIRVTTRRFPEMKHYGDVRKIDGAKIEPVDIITFGSPCQDLSKAGKHKGLDGSRSGLFFEAARIIQEMRKATDGKYPRYAIWENVMGTFESNEGEDFRIVLESLCSIKDSVSLPRPKRWSFSGKIVGDDFSLAWRTLDSQYWGIPQRRKRVFVVVDFRGYGAEKILFERKGACRNSSESYKAWTKYTGRIEKGLDRIAYGIARDNTTVGTNIQPSITAQGPSLVYTGLNKDVRRLTPLECCRLQGFPDYWCDNLETENPSNSELIFWRNVFKTIGKNKTEKQLRRWLKNPRSDAAEYKMWGNGIALPCAVFVMTGIAEHGT